jgi:replicative DNA helicase
MKRVPPADLQSERAVLTSALLDPEAFDVAAEAVRAEDYYSEGHRYVWEAMASLRAAGKPIDTITLRAALVDAGKLAAMGGDEALQALTDYVPPSEVGAYAARVIELAHRRRLIEAAHRIVVDGYDLGIDTSSYIEGAGRVIAELTVPELRTTVDYSTSEAVQAAVKHYWDAERRERPRVLIPVLSEAIGQAPAGSCTVIGGYTGVGKSGLMLMAVEAYRAAGMRPGVVSLEDPVEIWGERILAAKTGVSLATIDRERNGHPSRNEVAALQRGLEGLRTHPGRWACPPTYDIGVVLGHMRRHVVTHGCGAVFVDYLQEITRKDMPRASRAERMAQTAKDLKSGAKRLGVPLVLSSQLKRPDGKGGEPTLHDLKETGDLENIAEAVILLWRASDEDNAPTYGKVAKAKSSPKRPRFMLVRGDGGAVEDLVIAEPPQSGTRGGFR